MLRRCGISLHYRPRRNANDLLVPELSHSTQQCLIRGRRSEVGVEPIPANAHSVLIRHLRLLTTLKSYCGSPDGVAGSRAGGRDHLGNSVCPVGVNQVIAGRTDKIEA
jgi:hypothetical protein